MNTQLLAVRAVYKTGTRTRGRRHWDACVGTWGGKTRDLGTSSMGRKDVWDWDAGRQIQERGMLMIIEKVGGKSMTSLVNTFW